MGCPSEQTRIVGTGVKCLCGWSRLQFCLTFVQLWIMKTASVKLRPYGSIQICLLILLTCCIGGVLYMHCAICTSLPNYPCVWYVWLWLCSKRSCGRAATCLCAADAWRCRHASNAGYFCFYWPLWSIVWLIRSMYTVSQKKTRHQTLAHNFPKC